MCVFVRLPGQISPVKLPLLVGTSTLGTYSDDQAAGSCKAGHDGAMAERIVGDLGLWWRT